MNGIVARRQSVAHRDLKWRRSIPCATAECVSSRVFSTSRRAQVSAGFFGLRALVLLLFAAGLIAIGRPADAAALSSGSDPA